MHDGTGSIASAPVCAVTRRGVNDKYGRAALRITWTLRRIGRRISVAQSIRLGPAASNSSDDDVDLVVGQHAAGVFRERRHGSPGNSVGGYATNRGIVGDVDGKRVAHSRRHPPPSIPPLPHLRIF